MGTTTATTVPRGGNHFPIYPIKAAMKTLVFLVAAVTVVNGLTNLQINKITVKIGPAKTDGTDDDMFIKICDGAKCCQTKQLRHLLGVSGLRTKLRFGTEENWETALRFSLKVDLPTW